MGTLLAFATILAYVFSAARRIVHLLGDTQVARSAFERISEILSLPPETKRFGRMQPASIKGHVQFKKVTFSYNDKQTVLQDLNLEIKPGETIAIVGPSGIGKTTLINLLLGFYKPQYGQVLLDGIDVLDIDPKVLRKIIGVVPQEPFLFPDSVKQNILFGRRDATEEVIRAAKIANIHDFISSLPQGYDTKIGEKGLNISSGEKQRIAIARAVIRSPRILIFDEATSEIDQHSEKMILNALREVVKDRTTILITHRPSMLALASRIAVLNNGKIVAYGRDHELVDSSPAYVSLFDQV